MAGKCYDKEKMRAIDKLLRCNLTFIQLTNINRAEEILVMFCYELLYCVGKRGASERVGTLSTEQICDADGRPEVQVCIINIGCPWLPSWALVLLTFPTTNCGKSRFVETTACFSIVSFLKVRKSWREPMINTNEC